MTGLGGLTWPDVERSSAVLAVPLGSTEQHGPHLPLDTDTRIAAALAERLAARRADVVVAPPLPYGASGEHETFPGTVSLGTAVLEAALVELVRSASRTFPATVLVNGHGGNAAAVTAAARRLQTEGRRVLVWAPRVEGGDAHAGRVETSLLLALAPGLVRLEAAAAGNPAPLPDLLPAIRAGSVRDVTANGVLGDPAGASAEEGHALLDRLGDDLAATVERWLR